MNCFATVTDALVFLVVIDGKQIADKNSVIATNLRRNNS
jgi:hypothetical protein